MDDVDALIARWYALAGIRGVATAIDVLINRVELPEALALSMVMLPRTRIVSDVVILDIPGRDYANQEDLLREKLDGGRGTPEETQDFVDGFNWVEVAYLFSSTTPFPAETCSDEEVAKLMDDVDERLCRQIRDAWDAWLNWSYKDRSFEVFLISPEETGSSIGVGFREVAASSEATASSAR